MTETTKKQGTGALPGADLAPTGRAKCIHCAEAIAKGTVRIIVERQIQTGAFTGAGAGYLHPACAEAWAASGWPAGLDDLVQRVNESTSLDALPPPFGTAEAAPAPAEAAPKEKKERKPKAPKAEPKPVGEVPAYATLSGKQVAALAEKLLKLKESYKGESVLDKAGLDWSQRDGLRWHFVRHGLMPATHPIVLDRLASSVGTASADDVFAVLPALAAPVKEGLPLFDRWSMAADAIALRAFELDPVRLAAMLEGAPAPLRMGIQFVRGRHGVEIPAADRRAILRGLARTEAKEYGLARSHGPNGARLMIPCRADGKSTEPFGTALDLARLFGTEEEWLDALTDATRAGEFHSFDHVIEALVRLPADVFLAAASKNYQSSSAVLETKLQAILDRRADAPEVLLAAALAIPNEAYGARYLTQFVVPAALARMSEVPADVAEKLPWGDLTMFCSPARGYDAARANILGTMRVLGRDRVLALARQAIDRGYNRFQSLAFLGAFWDEGIARDAIAKLDDHADPSLFAPLGAQVLPLLVEGMSAEPPQGSTKEKRIALLRRGIQAVLAAEGAAGRTWDATYDAYVSCEPGERYWSDDVRNTMDRAIAGMPDARRIATLERLFAETKQVERPFFAVRHLASREALARAVRTMVKGYGNVADTHVMQMALQALPKDALAVFRPALIEEKPDAKLFESLKLVFGHDEVARVMKEGGVVEEKPFDRLQRLAREALAAGAPKSRIYLIERSDFDEKVPAPRAGSFSRARGAGPGIDRTALSLGEREHVLTVDLEEVPELARAGVRALSLYADDPEHGDAWEKARLVPVPAGSAAPTDGTPLTLVPIEVPSAIFDHGAKEDDPRIKEIGSLVFNRPGYVLGEPMFIQEPEEGGGEFVMQLAERAADINLGDSGSLYVFEGGSFMQCY